MTKTAMHAREMRMKQEEINAKVGIAEADRRMKVAENKKQRAHEKEENRKARRASIIGNVIGAGGRIAGAAIRANDPEWYKRYIKDLFNYTNLPTYDRLGNPNTADLLSITYDTDDNKCNAAVAGICRFEYIPTVGPQDNTNLDRNPINQILTRSIEKILALNSRSQVNYAPADLGYNFICTADIADMIAELGRVIKVYDTYRGENAYLAEALITALGWQYSDVQANIAEYRKAYTVYALRFNSALIAPNAVSLYNRRLYLSSNVFIDTEDKDFPRQMYVFVKKYYYRLNAAGDACDCLFCSSYRTGLSSFRTLIDLAISRIAEDASFIEMYQDLRHAFGEDLLKFEDHVDAMEMDFNTVPINREQIHNLKTLPGIADTEFTFTTSQINPNNWIIGQDTTNGFLYQGTDGGLNPVLGYREVELPTSHGADIISMMQDHIGWGGHQILNMHKANITGDDILDITRLAYAVRNQRYTSSKWYADLQCCGTEVVLSMDFYRFTNNGSYQWVQGSTYTYALAGSTTSTVTLLAARSKFDWAPIIHLWYEEDDFGPFLETSFDAHRTFTIARRDLQDLHQACVLSEFYIPNTEFKS